MQADVLTEKVFSPECDADVIEHEHKVISEKVEEFQVDLHGQQKEALTKIVDWYFNQPGNRVVTLKGAAGTGKTRVAQTVVKCIGAIEFELKGINISTALAAPTHKAVAVLQDFADAAGISNSCEIATIHSLLHVIPGTYDKNGNQQLKQNKNSNRPHLRQFDLNISDEASMICPELFKYATEAASKLVWIGDDYQLPYVSRHEDDESSSQVLKLSPVFTDVTTEQVELTETLRYDGAIAEYATHIRNNINAEKIKNPETGGNLTNLCNEEWEECFIERLKDDPLNVRAVAYTNNMVNSLANKARAAIYGDDMDYHVNEVLMAKELVTSRVVVNGREKDEILMHSCEECTVQGLDTLIAKIPFSLPGTPSIDYWKLDLSTNTREFTLYTPTKESLIKVVRPYMLNIKKNILAADEHKRGGMWKEFYETLSRMNLSAKGNTIVDRLQYAGVLTINQAQGSGFPVVFHNMRSCYATKLAPLRNRLNYTGMTRAKSELFVNTKYSSPTSGDDGENIRFRQRESKKLPLFDGMFG